MSEALAEGFCFNFRSSGVFTSSICQIVLAALGKCVVLLVATFMCWAKTQSN